MSPDEGRQRSREQDVAEAAPVTHELMILRHGKSDWGAGAARDFDRPLNKRGRKAAKRMGRWLLNQRMIPDHIVSSPAARARETVISLCRAAGLPDSMIEWDERLYEAGLGDLLNVVRGCPEESQRALIVGHNPGLEELVQFLSNHPLEAANEGPLMPTAALAVFETPAGWSQVAAKCARLSGITRPRELA